jgi:hypothetical protein
MKSTKQQQPGKTVHAKIHPVVVKHVIKPANVPAIQTLNDLKVRLDDQIDTFSHHISRAFSGKRACGSLTQA